MVTIYTKFNKCTCLVDRFDINFSLTIIFAGRAALCLLLLPPPPLVYHYQYYNQ